MGISVLRRENSSLGRIEISVFKGTRKQDRTKKNTDGSDYTYQIQGKDYNNQSLRIASNNKLIMSKLSQSYETLDSNGDIITPFIRIYLAYEEIEKVFQTSLRKHTKSGLEIVCDRQAIIQEMVTVKDYKGNVVRELQECNKPCPVAGKHLGYECQNGCKAQGVLYFYIQELFNDSGCHYPCKLTTHSNEDLLYIGDETAGFLKSTLDELGSICTPPFPIPKWKHHIPFILTRTEVLVKRPILENNLKTGKKSDDTHWALSLSVDPEYLHLHELWKQYEEMKRHNLSISQNSVIGLIKGDSSTVIDVDVVAETPKQLPSSLMTTADRYKARIKVLADEYKELIKDEYPLPDLDSMTENQLLELGKSLKQTVDSIRPASPVQI